MPLLQQVLFCCLGGLLCLGSVSCERTLPLSQDCTPTPADEIGPFYRPGAPVRSSVGTGYVLSGKVLSTSGCQPLAKGRIEFWLVNLNGEYDDAHRATMITDDKGQYRFEFSPPPDYLNRQPHVHIMVNAPGHETLITQHYPKEGDVQAEFDLILPLLTREK